MQKKKEDELSEMSKIDNSIKQILASLGQLEKVVTNLVSILGPHCYGCGSISNLSGKRILLDDVYRDVFVCDKCLKQGK
jgi:hypothetical protein